MRVAHLTRKPLSESSVARNVLEYGTGGLNIDATRLASGGEHLVARNPFRRSLLAGDEREGNARGMFDPGTTFVPTNHPGGRWPANLVLVHQPGCQCLGTKQAPATSIHGTATATRRSGVHADAGGHQAIGREQPVRGYANADGTETITAWDCAPGCPIAELDRQSGTASRFFKQIK